MPNESKGFFDAPPKTTFVMGLLAGLVLASIVGGLVFLLGDNDTTPATTAGTGGGGGAEAVAGTADDSVPTGDSLISPSNIAKYATELGLDTDKFNTCLSNAEEAEGITADLNEGVEIGVSGTPATFVNGYLVSGALPFEEFKGIIDEVLAGKEPTSQYIEAGGPTTLEVTSDDNVIGTNNAKVTLIEYADFECSFCQRHASTIKQLLSEYEGQIQVIYRHFPLSFHENAQIAAEAAECAANQDMFWEMHDKLFGV